MRRVNWATDEEQIEALTREYPTLGFACEVALNELGIIVTPDAVTARRRRRRTYNVLTRAAPASCQTPRQAPQPELPGPRHETVWERQWSTELPFQAPREGCVVWISDFHIPYHLPGACEAAFRAISDLHPTDIIFGGDVYDFYQLSDFEREPTRFEHNLQYEFDVGRKYFQEAVRTGANVHYLMGNHEDRMARTLIRTPGLWGLRSLEISVAAELPPEVHTYPYLTKLKFGEVTFHHGRIACAYTAATTWRHYQRTMVVGHTHRPDRFVANYQGTQVVVSGCLCDHTKARYCDDPLWGLGFVVVHYPTLHIEEALFRGGSVYVAGRHYRY